MKFRQFLLLVNSIFLFLLSGCSSTTDKNRQVLFTALDEEKTDLHFSNKLTPTDQFNVFHYMYYYNGAGIGAGDFNKDGKIDLFFASNQGANKIFLNLGNMKFRDVSTEANIPADGGWSTGVSVADVNNDGLLDIYICRVGNYEVLKSKNQLLICQGINNNGIPVYKDEAAQYGLDFSGFSTQAAFFDFDGDGDLDMFLLNHSVHQNGMFADRKNFLGTYSLLSGDRLYRNDGNKFTDITRQSQINSSAISYGLGIAVSDIDMDGYPDVYIGNDFHENDYLYINQHNGTFREENNDHIMHTSKFSMGVDVADLNNDAFPDIISMDMLPSDPYILKRSLGDDDYDIFYQKINAGYNYQYSRNNLQLNRRNGMFSEVGLYAGIAATDWSWAPLLMDFDNDGKKDLFISNGIPKRLTDIDYLNYVSSADIQQKINENRSGDGNMSLIEKFPQIKLPNKFFRNNGDVTFSDMSDNVEGNIPTYSNGSVYADLDNDGDLDIVVNNVDAPVMVYENKANDQGSRPSLEINLNGSETNRYAVGAKVIVYAKDSLRTYEKFAARGFMSSMETPLYIGMYGVVPDSIKLIWPDNTYENLSWHKGIKTLAVSYKKGLPVFDYKKFKEHYKNKTYPVQDITKASGLNYLHVENTFNEFDREPLMPHMVSTEGPALAVSDINGDGREDVFIGSSKGYKSAVYLQNESGRLIKAIEPALDMDSTFEDVSACWVDINNDKNPDLIIASGGNEYYGEEEYRMPRVYINDGAGKLTKLDNAFQGIYLTASCVVPCDYNKDGFIDLFVGGRAVPWAYGEIPPSYLLQNDGTGKFRDVTSSVAKDLLHEGMVTNAIWTDIDNDGDNDLIISLEWGGIDAFVNDHGHFNKKVLTDKKGWWNFILPCDLNGDGKIDLVAGNMGLNCRLKASDKEPVRLYYTDFDDNGKKDQVLTYYVNGKEIPFAGKDELQKQMPFLKKKYLYAADFAKADLEDMFTKDKLTSASILTANFFQSVVLMNNGNLGFSLKPLPWQAQLAPYRDAAVLDANGDKFPDILLCGNYYENNVQLGRNDADFGTLLVNQGNGRFSAESLNGLQVRGQVRHVHKITINGKESFILARNNDSTMVIQFHH